MKYPLPPGTKCVKVFKTDTLSPDFSLPADIPSLSGGSTEGVSRPTFVKLGCFEMGGRVDVFGPETHPYDAGRDAAQDRKRVHKFQQER
jgi:hypothetical protein